MDRPNEPKIGHEQHKPNRQIKEQPDGKFHGAYSLLSGRDFELQCYVGLKQPIGDLQDSIPHSPSVAV